MTTAKWGFVIGVLALVGCGGANTGAGSTNYTTESRSDNCGTDAACQASCQSISNKNPPPTLLNAK